MAVANLSSSERDRLVGIARQAGVPVTHPRPILLKTAGRPLSTPNHEVLARQFITQRRCTNLEGRASLRKSLSPVHEKFSFKETSQALSAAVAENAHPILVEALLSTGGDVNIARRASDSMWKKIRNVDQADQRNGVLEVATRNRNFSLVRLLAAQADQVALDASLLIALDTAEVDIVRVLLEYGANSEPLHDKFVALVRGGHEDLVELLLLAPRAPCMRCRRASLQIAVLSGSLRNTSMLVLSKAAAEDEEVLENSLHQALNESRLELFIAIIFCSEQPSSKVLDGVLALSEKVPAESRSLFTEVCILGGAQGSNCSEMLFEAVKRGEHSLVRTLINRGASIDHRDGAALQCAIEGHQAALLRTILTGNVTSSTLTTVIRAQKQTLLSDLNFAYEAMGYFIAAHATKEMIAELLCALMEQRQFGNLDGQFERQDPKAYKLALLLLGDGHADVNYREGRLVQLAVHGPFLDLLHPILRRKPSDSSLNSAFLVATKIGQDHPKRSETVWMLIKSGVRGPVVDKELVRACQQGPDAIPLVRVLLHGASVDFNHGQAVRCAIQNRWLELLKILLGAMPSIATMEWVWNEAGNLRDFAYLLEVFTTLLEANAKAAPVNQHLAKAAARYDNAVDLCKLLLKYGASTNYENGLSLVNAVRTGNVDVLELLIAEDPPGTCLSSALLECQKLRGKLRLNAVSLILRKPVQQTVIDGCLLAAVQEKPFDGALTNLFLEKGASVEHADALARAAACFNLQALQVVASFATSPAAFAHAFEAAVQVGDQWLSPEGLTVVQFLLDKGASGSMVDAALIQAARLFNHDAVGLLAETVKDPITYTLAFEAATKNGKEWLCEEGLELIRTYLAGGAGGEQLNMALLIAIDSYADTSASETLVDVLLYYKADVNYNGGHAIELAAIHGDVDLLRKLFKYRPTPQSMSLGLIAAAQASHEASRFSAVLNAFMQNAEAKPDLNFVAPGKDPLFFIVLNSYPESPEVIKNLCDFGVDLGASVACGVYDDDGTLGPDKVPALPWALVQPGNLISDAVIAELINAGGKSMALCIPFWAVIFYCRFCSLHISLLCE